jgi:serine/threonine-protein kinase
MLSCPYCGFKIGSGEHAEAWLGEKLDGKYQIEEILGVGGMGMVFKATRVFLGDSIALKILFPHLLHHALQRRLFEDEAIATAQLNHPNIVTIYDTDIDGDYQIAYMAMELLEGIPFKEVMREKAPMKAEDLYEPLIQICNGLYAAHELGLIHRDLKPDNLFVSPQKDGKICYKILDFGIATLAGEINEDEENKLLGTLRYMAPEQCLGQKVSPQTDIYALGIILYEALTRQRAVGKTVEAVLNDPIVPLRMRAKDIPPSFEKLIESMIEKKAENRPKSVLEVKKVVQALLGKEQIAQKTPTPQNIIPQKTPTPQNITPQNIIPQKTPTPQNITPQNITPQKEITPPPFIKPSVITPNPQVQQPQNYPPQNYPPQNYPPVSHIQSPSPTLQPLKPQQQITSLSQPQPNYAPIITNPPPIQVIQPMSYHSSKTFGWDDQNSIDLSAFNQPINEQSTAFLNTDENEQTNALEKEKRGFFTFSKLILISLIAMFLMIILKKFI